MDFFSKTPSSKDLLTHISSVSTFSTTGPHIPLFACPVALSDTLSIESLSMLTRIDVYRLWEIQNTKNIQAMSFFYYDDVISRPPLSNAKSILKHKKETDLLLYSLGIGGLIQNQHITFFPEFSSRIGSLFAKFFEKGYMKYAYQSVYRNTRFQTIAPPQNVRFEEKESMAYTIKYFISTKNHSLNIYIEDTSTIFGDVAIAFNPLHKKAKLLKGQMAIIPITNRVIPIIVDERVDFAVHGGVMRITPGHDDLSLSIAKDHDLPLNIESYDSYGNFTEYAGLFAGKSVEHFLPNIIQNLSDIGNLIDKKKIQTKIPFSRITNEMLIKRTHQGWFLNIPEMTMESFMNDQKIREHFDDKIPEISPIFPVSTPSSLGYRIPVWTKKNGEIIIIHDSFVIDAFVKAKPKKNNILISLLIFHAIQEGNLNTHFTLEDCLNVFFSLGFIKDENVLKSWIQIYKTRYPQYQKEAIEIENLIETLSHDSGDETAIEKFSLLLENGFGLSIDKKGMITFNITELDSSLSDAIQSKETISTYLLNHILILDTCGFFDDELKNLPIALFSEQEKQKFASCSLLGYFLTGGSPWAKALFYIPVKQDKPNAKRDTQTLKAHIQNYGSDVIRFHLINADHPKNLQTTAAFEETTQLLNTFWNANRFIKTTFFNKEDIFGSLDDIYLSIVAHTDEIHAFDNWIIGSIQALIEESKNITNPLDISSFSHKLLHFMKEDFSIKYIELIKTIPSKHSHQISLLVVGVLIKLFFPYTPLITKELWLKMGFAGEITDPLPKIFFPGLQKSYLTSLFMDLIDKFISLKAGLACKNHDGVSIFIKGTPDFLKFCKLHEALIQKTLHAEDITYLPYNEQAPNSYIQESIIDITIGIKRFRKDNPYCLAALTKKLTERQEYSQYLRNLLNNLTSNGGSPEVITKKRLEIQELKLEIEGLELEISKLKMSQ